MPLLGQEQPWCPRKALDRMSKRLVEEALKGAISGCVEEHRKQRVLLTDVGRPRGSTPTICYEQLID